MRLNYITMLAAATLFAAACNNVPEAPKGLTEPTATVLLYPEGQGVDKGIVEDGVAVTLGPGESNEEEGPEKIKEGSENISHVGDSARMELYIPEKPNGQMIVICPGGGYVNLAVRHEGRWVAEWLTQRGIAACVLIYRMPRKVHPNAPVTDVQNAMRYCRHHASEWGVDQIGVMGFSAGGHLAGCASTLYTDSLTRPDFSVLIYPVITFDEDVKKRITPAMMCDEGRRKDLLEYYSLENRVDENTPPAFIVQCLDDKGVIPEHGYRYINQLRLHGAKGEMYILPYGGHGWGWKTEDHGVTDPLAGGVRELFFSALENFLGRIAASRDAT